LTISRGYHFFKVKNNIRKKFTIAVARRPRPTLDVRAWVVVGSQNLSSEDYKEERHERVL